MKRKKNKKSFANSEKSSTFARFFRLTAMAKQVK